jgi:hypothetical protein
MKKLSMLLLLIVLITSCKNDDKTRLRKEGDDNEDRDTTGDREKDTSSVYTWTKREQNKFIEDCRRASAEKADTEKIKDFCFCLLTQAQKYYPSYEQIDKKSNEDYESKMYMNCYSKYPAGEDDK